MNFLKKIKDILIFNSEFEDEDEMEIEEQVKKTAETRGVVNGVDYTPVSFDSTIRPKLTVRTSNQSEFSVKIYLPKEFNDVKKIADDLKNKQAVIVNFENVPFAEQRRICDFVNGACYCMDGQARRVSDSIVIYVPVGVSVSAAVSKPVLR